MQVAGVAQQLDDGLLGAEHGLAGELGVGGAAGLGDDRVGSLGEARVRRWPMIARLGRSSSRHHMTSVTSPKVQIMAMPVPLSFWARWCASTGTSTPNSGVRHGRAEQRLVALVVGVRDERDAGGEQLGAASSRCRRRRPSGRWNATRW